MTYSRKLAAALAASVCVVAIATPAQAQVRQFHIGAGSLKSALDAWARQSGRQVIYKSDEVRSARSRGAKGSMSPDAALEAVLAASGFTARRDASGAVAIVRSAEGNAQATAPNGRDKEQDPSSSGQDAGSKEAERGISEILVVGSRSQNVDIGRTEDDAQPYVVLDSKRIARSGAANVEDFLKQQVSANTSTISNSQRLSSTLGNTSSINLRGLGDFETLVLVNGRRMAGVNPGGLGVGNERLGLNQPDINGIPLSAIDRIEVLPTSASAIYGGSALGGVINIILKKEFEGGSLRYSFDNPTSGNAPIHTVNGTYGFSLFGGATQIMVGGQYSRQSPLRLGDRENIISRNIQTILGNSPSFLYSIFNPFPGATTNIASSPASKDLVLRSGASLGSPITFIPTGTTVGTNISSGLVGNAGRYNLNLADGNGLLGLRSTFGSPATTKSAFATLRQNLFGDVTFFSDVSFSNNSSDVTTNPFTSNYTVLASAPTNPFTQNVRINFPSKVEEHSRTTSKTTSANAGVIVPFSSRWSAELDYTWSRNSFHSSYVTSDTTSLQAAMNAGTVNPFIDTIAFPQSLTPYANDISFSGQSTLGDLGLRVSGSLMSLPGGSAAITIGLDRRIESRGDATQTLISRSRPAINSKTTYFSTSQGIESVYAEALLPLIGPKQSIGGLYSLEIQVAGRMERYQVSAGTPYATVPARASDPPLGLKSKIRYSSTNPTVAIKYQPTASVSLRASYARAFLPPTPAQLQVNPRSLCGGVACASIQDPANGQVYLVDATGGGNPGLEPQRSTSWNFGLIWEPVAGPLKGMRASVDYYRIAQPNYIVSGIAPQQVVSDPALKSRLTRDPATGLITLVDLSTLNAELYKTSGWDFSLGYTRETGLGNFDLRAAGTLISNDLRQYEAGSALLDYVGYPTDGGTGKFKGNLSLGWSRHGWSAGWSAVYYSKYRQSGAPGSPSAIQNGAPITFYTDAQGGFTVPAQMYHSVFLSYRFGEGSTGAARRDFASGLEFQLSVENLFNKVPPFDASAGPYYYSTYGDPRLRRIRLSIQKQF